MPRSHNRERTDSGGPLSNELAVFDPGRILAGLAPQLVITLAQLVGASLEDLQVTIQLLPWGDRATLAAYKAIEMETSKGAPRKIRVLPECVDLTYAAAELVAEAVSEDDVARLLDAPSPEASLSLPSVSVEVASSTAEQQDAGHILMDGVVTDVIHDQEGAILTVLLDEYANTANFYGFPKIVRLTPHDRALAVMEDSTVTVAFAKNVTLGSPTSIAIRTREPH